jgi:16S rRNA A1518/A1519 N6-dimethyltransferase RsmA/KsgA/DIM1 with predicted DNA glycosylase/AP lyase activity
MVRSSLKSLFPDPEKILQELALDPQKRAEDLEVCDFIRLT